MIVRIYYDRLCSDGSLMDHNMYEGYNSEWDMGELSNIIARFYKEYVTYNIIRITNISIERD